MRRCTILAAVLAACASKAPREQGETETRPPEARGSEAAKVAFSEHTIPTEVGDMRVWLYAPEPMPAAPGLVVVPPAGSNLVTGMRLGKGDRAEHEPYVRAGYVVAAFDIAGDLPESPTAEQFGQGMVDFLRSQAGLFNARTALELAQERFPAIDAERVYAAGHSSAGTLVLLFAAVEPRVRAVAAFAPVVDVPGFLPAEIVTDMDGAIPGFRDFLAASSPVSHAKALAKKPVFLFHAADDTVVSPDETTRLFDAMGSRDPSSKRMLVQTGNHYDSMIAEGIPAAIAWFEALPVGGDP